MAQLINIAALRRCRLAARSRQGNLSPRVESLPPLRILPAKRAADTIAPFAWSARVRFFDKLVGEGLVWVGRELGSRDRDALEARWVLRDAIADLRGTLTDILDRLHRGAPLAPDGNAMRIYRVSDDPRRIAEAQRYWGNAEAERRGMVPGSNLMVLRNVVIKLESLCEDDECASSVGLAP